MRSSLQSSETATAAEAWYLIALVAAMVPAMFWIAYVLATLWGWFVVPMGVAPIGLAQALGLSLMCKLVFSRSYAQERQKVGSWALAVRVVVEGFLGPLMALGMGWLLRGVM